MGAFTMQEFLTLIADSNARYWPMALVAYALGSGAVVLVVRRARFASTIAAGVLTLFWLWTGLVFNGLLLSGLWRGAVAVAAVFVVQAALLALTGVVRHQLRFGVATGAAALVGGLAILYAMVGYPLVAALAGRGYPQSLLLGLAPCPTVAFTLGLLLWSRPPLPKVVLAIPVVIALGMGGVAASVGIVEDLGLMVIAVLAGGLLLARDRELGHSARMRAHGTT